MTAERAADQDCFACHSTGAHDPKGPQSPSAVTQVLQGVGCEACHGAGAEHVKAPGPGMSAPTEATCTACHDGVRDEGRDFDYAQALPQVAH